MRQLFSERTGLIDTENAFKIGPQIAEIERAGHRVIKLNLGEPDFNIPTFIKDEIKAQIDLNNTHYCDPKGLLSLRTAIAHQLEETRDLKYSPEQIVIFPGAKPIIGFCQQTYCNPGDEIIYPSPGFPIYESFIRYVGATPVPLHLREENGFQLTADELAALITPRTKLIILNFPSNPTGGVATPEQLTSLAQIINQECDESVRILSDEIYEYIVFDGKKHVSPACFEGMQQRTIVSSGFSKTFAWTGGRIGYAAFPTVEEAEVIKNLNINYFSCIPPYNQEGAREAYEHIDTPATVRSMVATFEHRRNVILGKLNEIDGMTCTKPGGAFYLFPNIEGACEKLGILKAYEDLPAEDKEKTSPSTLFQSFALKRHHVAVMDRRSFGRIGAQGQHYIRLSCAADLAVLEKGVERLAQACLDREGCKAFLQGDH